MTEKLPEFARPPVIETVLGVQFNPIPACGAAHLGGFWRELGVDWPYAEDAPPIEFTYERFGDDIKWWAPGVRLKIGERPEIRLRIRNGQKDRLLQIQNGRFHYNWVKTGPDQPYPSYSRLRPEFWEHFDRLRTYFAAVGLGDIVPNQWEVTYVNHIPKGPAWERLDRLDTLFAVRPLTDPTAVGLEMDGLSSAWHYVIPDKKGRLHVEANYGRTGPSNETEVIVLKLTARGPIAGDTVERLDEGLDLGRATIVRTFNDLTTPAAWRLWEMIE